MGLHGHGVFLRHSGATTRLSVKERGRFTVVSDFKEPIQVMITVTFLWPRTVGGIGFRSTVTVPRTFSSWVLATIPLQSRQSPFACGCAVELMPLQLVALCVSIPL